MYRILYLNQSVEDEILRLPSSLGAQYFRLTNLMRAHGSNLGMPHTKSLSEGLFELRLKGQEGIARVFYCTQINKKIIILHSFIKKTNKIPAKELKIARNKLLEVKRDERYP